MGKFNVNILKLCEDEKGEGHSIAPKTTSANAASASPQRPNEKSRKRQSSYMLG